MKSNKGQAVLEWCIFGAIGLWLTITALRVAVSQFDQQIAESYSIFAARQALSRSPTPSVSSIKIHAISSENSGISIVKKNSIDQKVYHYQQIITLPDQEKIKKEPQVYKLF